MITNNFSKIQKSFDELRPDLFLQVVRALKKPRSQNDKTKLSIIIGSYCQAHEVSTGIGRVLEMECATQPPTLPIPKQR